MTIFSYGKKAYAIKGKTHVFKNKELIIFLEMDSEVNVNSEEKYYVFMSSERVLTQTITEEDFEWI